MASRLGPGGSEIISVQEVADEAVEEVADEAVDAFRRRQRRSAAD